MSDRYSPPVPPEATSGLRFVLLTVALLLALDLVSSIFALGWKAIVATLALMMALFIGRIVLAKDKALLGWLVFGLVAGFAELVADWWLVRTGTLIYPQDEPMLWASPAYMPVAWAVVLTQVGTVATWLRSRLPALQAGLATALFAGINIPVYEHLAKGAKWWYYVETPMLFDAPYYVIVAEFLLALPLALWAGRIVSGRLRDPVLLGLVEGLVMLAAVIVAFWLVGPCEGAVIQLPCR